MKVGFFSNQLSLRGTEEVMYSYADYNETVLNNTSVIISFPLKTETKDTTKESYERFEKRFETFYITDEERIIQHQLDALIVKEKIDVLYIAKWGIINNTITSKCPTIVHAVFKMCQPHGDVYVGVSEYVATQAGFPPTQCLPNIVRPCSITTSEPMSSSAMVLMASPRVWSGCTVNKVLPLTRRMSVTFIETI